MNSNLKTLFISCFVLLCTATLFTQCTFSSNDDEFVSIEYSTPKDLQILIDEKESSSSYIFTDVQKSSVGYGIWTHIVYHTAEAQEKEAYESDLSKIPASQSIHFVINLDENKLASKASIWYDADGNEIESGEIEINELEWIKIVPGTLGALCAKCVKEIITDTFEYELD